MYCPTCRAEYRSGFSQCADCGSLLVEALEPLPIPLSLNTRSQGLFSLVLTVALASAVDIGVSLLPLPAGFSVLSPHSTAPLWGVFALTVLAVTLPSFVITPTQGRFTPRLQLISLLLAVMLAFAITAAGARIWTVQAAATTSHVLLFSAAAAVFTGSTHWIRVSRGAAMAPSLGAYLALTASFVLIIFLSWAPLFHERIVALLPGSA